MSHSNWLITVLDHPGHQTNIRQIGTANETINDPTLSLDSMQKLHDHNVGPTIITPNGDVTAPTATAKTLGWSLKCFCLTYLLPPTLIETMANLPNSDPN
jgi:hypothetical protein